MNTIARGISVPNSVSTPERFHRISVKAMSDTTASSKPMASFIELLTKLSMSCWIR